MFFLPSPRSAPSNHPSSLYEATHLHEKLESQCCRTFVCRGIALEDLYHLLKHIEEAHTIPNDHETTINEYDSDLSFAYKGRSQSPVSSSNDSTGQVNYFSQITTLYNNNTIHSSKNMLVPAPAFPFASLHLSSSLHLPNISAIPASIQNREANRMTPHCLPP